MFAVDQGYMDEAPLKRIGDFEHELLGFARSNYGAFMETVTQSGDYNDEIVKTMRQIIETFMKNFTWA